MAPMMARKSSGEHDLSELGAHGVHGFERIVFEDFLRIFILEIFSLDKIQGSQW